MPAFELFQPTSVADTLGLLDRHGAEAWVMAGGMDTFDWLKDRISKPSVVVDLSGVSELRGIKEANGGLEIGAMTTLTEVANHALVKDRYALLAQAAGLVASPQIRNQGTHGRQRRPRMPGAGTTAPAGPAIAPAATSATPTRRPR